MRERVLFVAGDVGGASVQAPVAKMFLSYDGDYEVRVLTDAGPRAKSQDAWTKANIPFEAVSHEDAAAIDKYLKWADAVVSGSCSTAYQLERAVVKRAKELGVSSAILADVVFSHSAKQFRDLEPTVWLAIDQPHKEAIMALRSGLSEDKVVVTGQPTYDNLLGIIEKRVEIRSKHRALLGVEESDYLVMYSSPGDKAAHFETTLEMTFLGLQTLKKIHGDRLVFLPRLHPKLGTSTKCDGYVAGAYTRVEEFCKSGNIRLVRADKAPMDELDVTVDLLTCAMATDGTKTVIMGGLVVFLMPDTVQHRMRVEFLQESPYLPELRKQAAFGVFCYSDIENIFKVLQQPMLQGLVRSEARKHFSLPEDRSATENVFKAILRLARAAK